MIKCLKERRIVRKMEITRWGGGLIDIYQTNI
jgi:hypothetical protein